MCSFFWQTKSKTHTRLLHFELHLNHFWIHITIRHSSFDVSSVGKYVAMVTSLMLVLCNISGISWVWRNVVYLCALNLIDSNKKYATQTYHKLYMYVHNTNQWLYDFIRKGPKSQTPDEPCNVSEILVYK